MIQHTMQEMAGNAADMTTFGCLKITDIPDIEKLPSYPSDTPKKFKVVINLVGHEEWDIEAPTAEIAEHIAEHTANSMLSDWIHGAT